MRKCPYCDFNSHSLRGEIDELGYVEALLRDLDWELAREPESRPISTTGANGAQGSEASHSPYAPQRRQGRMARPGGLEPPTCGLEALFINFYHAEKNDLQELRP